MAPSPIVAVQLPGSLRQYCDGSVEVRVPGRSVRAVFEHLRRHHAALYPNLCDEQGAIRRHLNVFINADNIRDLDGVDTALASGDVMTILPAVSGG